MSEWDGFHTGATGGAHVPTPGYSRRAAGQAPTPVMSQSSAARGRAAQSKPNLSDAGLLLASSTGSYGGIQKPPRPSTGMLVPPAFSALQENLSSGNVVVHDSLTQSICAPEGGQEMVYKLIAQSAAATSTVQGASEASRKNATSRGVQSNVLAQTVQGTSTYGAWEVDLADTFPTQQVVSMEISGWTLPPSQWTVEAQRTNIALGFGTYFDLDARAMDIVLGGAQSGVPEVMYEVLMPLQKAECFEVERVDDEFGVPTGRIRFFFIEPVGSYFRTAIVTYQIWQGTYSLQGLRGVSEGVYILDPTKMPALENNRDISTFLEFVDPELIDGIESLGLWADIGGRTLMKPRVLGDIILPQCALSAPSVPSPYQLADLINAITQDVLNDTDPATAGSNAVYGNIFSFACNYKPELDRFQIDFQIKNGPGDPDEPGFEERLALINADARPGISTPLNRIVGDQLFVAMGFDQTIIPNSNIANVTGRSVKLLGARQRVHPPNAYARVEPGVYESGARLAHAVTAAFDAAWFGPANETPENGNAPPFVLTIRKSTGQNVYVNVRSGRYTPQQLAAVVQQSARASLQCAAGQVTCDNPDCDLGLVVRPLVITDTNFFVGLTFESPFGITFELQFAEATTTLSPESIGYKRRAYTGGSTYFPDAAGTLAGATVTSVPVDGANANLLRIQTSQSSVIAEEYFNGRHISLYHLGNISGMQLPPFRMDAIFEERRRHMTLESIALPAMHNCFVLCEDEDASALFLETPIAHGLAPGAVLTLNIGAGSWLTGLSTISPGMALAARDRIVEGATNIAALWSSALSVVSSCQGVDPNAQVLPSNAEAWRRLVAAIAYGTSAAQGYIQWCTFIKAYLRTVTLSFDTSQAIAKKFFEIQQQIFCAIIECEFQILSTDTDAVVEPEPPVFAIAYNYVCRTLSTSLDIMFTSVLTGGARTDNMCYLMYVTLSAVYNFTTELASYARTNAVVVNEPEPVVLSQSSLDRTHPEVRRMLDARVALAGGKEQFDKLSRFLNNEHTYLGFARSTRGAYYVATKRSVTHTTDVCEQSMQYYRYMCGSESRASSGAADVVAANVNSDARADSGANANAYGDADDVVSTRTANETSRVARGDVYDAQATRKATPRRERGMFVGYSRSVRPDADFGSREEVLSRTVFTEDGESEEVVVLAPAAGRLNKEDALRNMQEGIGISSKPLTTEQHNTHDYVVKREDALSRHHDTDARSNKRAGRRRRVVSHKHIVMLDNDDAPQRRDDFATAVVAERAKKQVRDATNALLDATKSPDALPWMRDVEGRFGQRAAIQAARRMTARAHSEKESRAVKDMLTSSPGGFTMDPVRAEVSGARNGAGDPCAPILEPNCDIEPPVFDRVLTCSTFQYVGNTCAVLCGGPSAPECRSNIVTLPPRESRVLLILGRYPAGTTKCSAWPFSREIFTNVRLIPTVNDIYEVNFRDPPPTLSVNGDGPAIENMMAPSVIGFEPVPAFSFGFRVLSAPNVITLTGPPFCILDVSIDPQEDIVQSGGFNPVFNYAGKGKIVTPQRVLTQAIFFGSVAAGEVDKRMVIPMNNITKVQRVVVKILTPDNRPVNFHGQNASLLLRLVVIGQRTSACNTNTRDFGF